MKTKYTRKQIQEAISHWSKVLDSMNESTLYEQSIARNIVEILKNKYSQYSNIDLDKDIKLFNKKFDHNLSFQSAPQPIQVWCSGANDTSDIYIVLDPDRKVRNRASSNPMVIGIEVKERSKSILFNPSLTYVLAANGKSSSLYLSKGNTSATNLNALMRYQSKLLPSDHYEIIKKKMNSIANLVFRPNFPNVTRIPTSAFDQQTKDIALKMIKRIESLNVKNNSAKSILLDSYKISDNDIVKMYFNEIRQNTDNDYYPVQYIQYDNKLFRIDNTAEFFSTTGRYIVSDYDDEFTGIKVSWYLDFSNRHGENAVTIRGIVTSYTDSLYATLENTNTIDIDDNCIMDALK